MISRTKFQVEINGEMYSASGYMQEVDNFLLFWDLDIAYFAFEKIYGGHRKDTISFKINDIRYTNIAIDCFFDAPQPSSANYYAPVAHFIFKGKE